MVQQMISPPQFTGIVPLSGNNQLNLTNVPVGLNGFVLATTNLAPANWTTNATFNSTNLTQSVLVPASGSQQFYRLYFPYAWSWP
jgi:hypothetical protein